MASEPRDDEGGEDNNEDVEAEAQVDFKPLIEVAPPRGSRVTAFCACSNASSGCIAIHSLYAPKMR